MIKLSQVVGYHTMARAPATYVYGIRPATPPADLAAVTWDAIEQFYAFHPEATCSTRTARALAFIESCRR